MSKLKKEKTKLKVEEPTTPSVAKAVEKPTLLQDALTLDALFNLAVKSGATVIGTAKVNEVIPKFKNK